MQKLRRLAVAFRALFRRRELDQKMGEEMRSHIELRTQANIATGMPPEHAAREARRTFGNVGWISEECRAARGVAWLEGFLQDLRYGSRLWKKHPGSFIAAVVALTLGIGLVTFSLSVINCVFFGRLPFPDADRLVYTTVVKSALREFQEQQTTFDGLAAFSPGAANFKAIDAPSHRPICFISANFLDVIQSAPLLGRGFLPGEGKPGAEPVALLGYDLWQEEFHGSLTAIGSIIRLDGQPRTVVGIMPEGFKFPINESLWIPANSESAQMSGWGFVFGRLKPGVSKADARAELNLIATRLAQSGESGDPRLKDLIKVGPFTRFEEMKGANGPGPGVLATLVVTLLVLFIACANVAGLTLANASKRGTELAVRGTLGATRARLISQMLIESLILAVCGAVCALGMIAISNAWVRSFLAANQLDFSNVPFWMNIRIDGRLLMSLIGLIFLTNLLAGLWPALQATKRDVNELLKAGGIGVSGSHQGKLQWLLATLQTAFSVVVVTQSVVLLVFSQHLRQSHLTFDPAAVLTARVVVPPSASARSFFAELEPNLAAIPGVQAVALSSSDPASGHSWNRISVEDRVYPRPEDHPYAGSEIVSPGYFQTLNISILDGRGFNARDAAGSTPVAVVNSTFARMFLPPGNPLGRRFRAGTNDWLTIVGCMPDLKYDPSEANPEPTYLVPAAQQPVNSMVVMLRGAGRPTDWTKTLSAEVARLQPDLAIYQVATVRSLINHQIIGYYLASLLLGICGGASLFLATLGIFGLISLSVSQRTREIGVRLALGATRGRVVITLLKRAICQIATGLVLGLLMAVALNQVLNHSIAGYPTVSHPALVFLAALAFLGSISLLAVLLPALRGARVDPMVALRYE